MSQYTLQSPTINTDGVSFWALINPDSTVIPFEYTGWKDEVCAWQDNAYIGSAISDTIFPYDITGKGAKEFMKKYFVNNFDNVTWGKSKHGMMLQPNGNIAGDGVVLPISEEKYITTSCWPYIQYCLDREHAAGNMLDVEGTFNPESFIMYQVGGPRSLEIIERATGEDFHDLEYLCFRDSTIAGCPVRVLRLGMAGTLSYEVHIQSYEYCEPVYGALIAAGEKYEARRLGYHAYMMNHTENGFAQSYYHFLYDYRGLEGQEESFDFCGTADDRSIESYFFNPIELGLGYCINWNHDFRGKQALLDYKASGHTRNIVTLEWNVEDIVDVYRSQWDLDEEPYFPIDDMSYTPPKYTKKLVAPLMKSPKYKVFKDDKEVGVAFMHTHSPYYRRIIQLAVIDDDQREIGNELEVLFGEEGFRCKRIRATVEKFPYNKHHERIGLSL